MIFMSRESGAFSRLTPMLIRVLGSAAGGGFPQWNCNCPNCAGLRSGSLRTEPRTQCAIAVSVDGITWILCNASPDLRPQIEQHLAPRHDAGIRSCAIGAIILLDAQIEHVLGLLLLREHDQPLQVWSTQAVHDDLTTGLPILNVLEHYCGAQWHCIEPHGIPISLPALPGITVRALAVPGRPAPYSSHRDSPRPGDHIGLIFEDERSARRLLYAPGLGSLTPALQSALAASHCVLVDGTFWSDEEMIELGVSQRRAADLGHLAQSGAGGMLEALQGTPDDTRRILIHINNTNPILDEFGPERRLLTGAGIEVAYDGMEIVL
jgi:pyrroloquinoline quinone biosynthesis protein B